VPPETTSAARSEALAELKAEADRFASKGAPEPPQGQSPARPEPRRGSSPPRVRGKRPPTPDLTGGAQSPGRASAGLAGYVPNAVAPERGNTRPLVPVDGRLHLRAAPAMIVALDEVVAALRTTDPTGLRDLERATLVRIGAAIVLADVAAHGAGGLVGEAVRAALNPTQRHLDVAMPSPARWLRDKPEEG
jgi:hypothetical protein